MKLYLNASHGIKAVGVAPFSLVCGSACFTEHVSD